MKLNVHGVAESAYVIFNIVVYKYMTIIIIYCGHPSSSLLESPESIPIGSWSKATEDALKGTGEISCSTARPLGGDGNGDDPGTICRRGPTPTENGFSSESGMPGGWDRTQHRLPHFGCKGLVPNSFDMIPHCCSQCLPLYLRGQRWRKEGSASHPGLRGGQLVRTGLID